MTVPYTWAVLLVASAAAYPANLQGVPGKDQTIMRARGGYRAGIFAGQKLACRQGEGFVVWNAAAVGGRACSGGRCNSNARDDYPLTVDAKNGVGVVAVCAGAYGVLREWGGGGMLDGVEVDLYSDAARDFFGNIGGHATQRPYEAVYLFWFGSALAFAGVAAHAAAAMAPDGSTKKALLNSHYYAMPLALVLLTVASLRAHNGAASRTRHGISGTVTLVCLWLVAVAGSVHKLIGKRKKWLAQAHRLAGFFGIVLVAGMASSSRDPLERAGATDAMAQASAHGGFAYMAVTLTVLLAGVAYSYRKRMQAWPVPVPGSLARGLL